MHNAVSEHDRARVDLHALTRLPSDALAEVNAEGCPVPCNPKWSASDINAVCGNNRVCCQSVELEPEDCAFDPELGDGGCWRPVTGNDIAGFGGLDASDWSTMDHATHQDPGGTSCQAFVSGIPSEVFASYGVTEQDVLLACFRRLGVADLRGFCTTPDPACPFADPSYVDACEQLNLDEGRSGCA